MMGEGIVLLLPDANSPFSAPPNCHKPSVTLGDYGDGCCSEKSTMLCSLRGP